MKIHPVGAQLLQADSQTDMTKLLVTFRNFAKALKMHLIVITLTFVRVSLQRPP
jgi:hypothetical protein